MPGRGRAPRKILTWRSVQVLRPRIDEACPDRGAILTRENPLRVQIWLPTLLAVVGVGLLSLILYVGVSAPAPPPAPTNRLVPAAPRASAFGWRLTSAVSAHRALVLEVESTRPGEAVAIAQQLTEPYKDRFDEVLVFFFEPNVEPRRASVRVQWTRAHGYRTLLLRASQ